MAAAGVDASNVEAGSVVLLPLDPDASARDAPRRGCTSAPAPTSAWSSPTPPAAPGARARPTSPSVPPGCVVAEDFAGRTDAYGNALAVTLPAVADELAGAAELAQGKLARSPVRGRPRPRRPRAARRSRTAPAPRPLSGPRAATCSGTAPARPSSQRWRATPPTVRPFGAPGQPSGRELASRQCGSARLPDGARRAVRGRWRRGVCFAHGWSGRTRRAVVSGVDRALRRLCRRRHTVRVPPDREIPAPWPRRPRPTVRRSSTRSATSRSAPRSGAASRSSASASLVALLIVGAAAFQPIKDWWDLRVRRPRLAERSVRRPPPARTSRRRRPRAPRSTSSRAPR